MKHDPLGARTAFQVELIDTAARPVDIWVGLDELRLLLRQSVGASDQQGDISPTGVVCLDTLLLQSRI